MLPDKVQMFNRDRLRREILAIRDSMPRQVLEEKSRQIEARLWQINQFSDCRTVMFYASFRSEVRTAAAIAKCLEAGVRVALPLSIPGSRKLLPYLVEDPGRELRSGYCGIPEPDPARTRSVPPDQIEAVVVPGAVFDLRGGDWDTVAATMTDFWLWKLPGPCGSGWLLSCSWQLEICRWPRMINSCIAW